MRIKIHNWTCVTYVLAILLLSTSYSNKVIAQASSPYGDKAISKYLSAVQTKAEKYSLKLDKQSSRYLRKLQKLEKKLQLKLRGVDSVASPEVFAKGSEMYEELQHGLVNGLPSMSNTGMYLPYFDSLNTSLKFLQSNAEMLNRETLKQVEESLLSYGELEGSLMRSQKIAEFIQQRKSYLSETLGNLAVARQLKAFNKSVHYYSQQVNEYKALIQDQQKLEAKGLALISNMPAFRDFMKSNSMLAMMFPVNPTENSLSALEGLQTRIDVEELLKKQFGSTQIASEQFSAPNFSNGESYLRKVHQKLYSMQDKPEAGVLAFKPNTQKTKPFLKRLELSSNIQTRKGNQYIPSTADLGVSVGYKLSDKGLIGIGMAYKVGLGSDIRNIRISHEGVGLRSFLDVKLKYRIWISGGAEVNYRESFHRISALQQYSAWKPSALLGVTKKYKASKKMNGSIQLLYDFLYKDQLMQSQPLVFRVGYSL